jgi:hypothetical protein
MPNNSIQSVILKMMNDFKEDTNKQLDEVRKTIKKLGK